jgi:hypothetical protein
MLERTPAGPPRPACTCRRLFGAPSLHTGDAARACWVSASRASASGTSACWASPCWSSTCWAKTSRAPASGGVKYACETHGASALGPTAYKYGSTIHTDGATIHTGNASDAQAWASHASNAAHRDCSTTGRSATIRATTDVGAARWATPCRAEAGGPAASAAASTAERATA